MATLPPSIVNRKRPAAKFVEANGNNTRIAARFMSRCPICGMPIDVGDDIYWRKDEAARHWACHQEVCAPSIDWNTFGYEIARRGPERAFGAYCVAVLGLVRRSITDFEMNRALATYEEYDAVDFVRTLGYRNFDPDGC